VVTKESYNKRATVIAAQQQEEQLNLITLCSCRCPGQSPGTHFLQPIGSHAIPTQPVTSPT